MSSPQTDFLKLALNKYVEGIPEQRNDAGKFPLRQQLRNDMRDYAVLCMENMLKSIAAYGTNTHTYAEAYAFLVEFKSKV